MKPLSLIYTTSCQNYKPTKQIFKELGLAFMKIYQHHCAKRALASTFHLRHYTSRQWYYYLW